MLLPPPLESFAWCQEWDGSSLLDHLQLRMQLFRISALQGWSSAQVFQDQQIPSVQKGLLCFAHRMVCFLLNDSSFSCQLFAAMRQFFKNILRFWLLSESIMYLSVVDFQCCDVVLICAVQQSDSVTHTCILLFIFFSIIVYCGMLNIVPCAAQQDLVVYPSWI